MTTPMNRRELLASLALAGSGLAAAQGSPTPGEVRASAVPGDARAKPVPAIGTPLPLTDVALLDGSTWRAGAAAGQVVLVYWWASWCPFCAVQSPHIEKLWRKERARGLSVLALSIDRTPEAAVAYMKQKGYTFPAGMLTPDVAKVLPKPKGLPVVVVRGRDGKVVFAEAGELLPEDIEGLAKYL